MALCVVSKYISRNWGVFRNHEAGPEGELLLMACEGRSFRVIETGVMLSAAVVNWPWSLGVAAAFN